DPVLRALAAYRSGDGGHGHALKPSVRRPFSETTSTLHALEVLDELAALVDLLADVADWVGATAISPRRPLKPGPAWRARMIARRRAPSCRTSDTPHIPIGGGIATGTPR